MTQSTEAVPAPDVAILSGGVPLDIVERSGRAVALAWPGTGSHVRSMHRIELEAGGRTHRLRHESEAVYFVSEGAGLVGSIPVGAHEMIYVPSRATYRFESAEGMTLVGGPCPPDAGLYGPHREVDEDDGPDAPPVRVYDAEREGEPLPMIGKQVRLVVWPGVGADVATMNFAVLEPGEENQPHAHAESDDTIAILEGRGSIDDVTNGVVHEFTAGDVVFVRAGITHKVKADKGVTVVSAGGPCPPDYGMLRALGIV